jgi:hypothetical protein
MVQWNSYKDWGTTISTMGMIDFGFEKKFDRFFVRQRLSPFSESFPILVELCAVIIQSLAQGFSKDLIILQNMHEI